MICITSIYLKNSVKKFKFLIVALSVIFFNLKSNSQNNKYLDYYSNINKAELLILDSNYVESCFFYKKAFKTVPVGFGKDYYNAAICAAYTNDEDLLLECFSQLALKGVSLNYIKKHIAWKYIKNHTILSFFEINIFDKCRNKYLKEKNITLNKELSQIFEIDQDIHLKKYKDEAQRHTNNLFKLDSLINIYGFPSEELIGLGDTMEVVPLFLNVLYSRYAKEYKNNKFFNILKEATLNGKLPPALAAFYMSSLLPTFELETTVAYKVLMDSSQLKDLNLTSKINKWVYPIYSENHLQKINKNRKEIGWEDFLSYQRKVIYNLKYHKFILSLIGGLSIYQCNSQYLAEKYLNNIRIIEDIE